MIDLQYKSLTIEDQALQLARKDAEKADIQTTAEGKSYLRGRYEKHYKRLTKEQKKL